MTLDYGNYGIFLIMGNAGFISSTVVEVVDPHFEKPQSPPGAPGPSKPAAACECRGGESLSRSLGVLTTVDDINPAVPIIRNVPQSP